MAETTGQQPAANTDRELYREDTGISAGSYYENSVHVTAAGTIGMNVGGRVFSQPIAAWHRDALTIRGITGFGPDGPRTALNVDAAAELALAHEGHPLPGYSVTCSTCVMTHAEAFRRGYRAALGTQAASAPALDDDHEAVHDVLAGWRLTTTRVSTHTADEMAAAVLLALAARRPTAATPAAVRVGEDVETLRLVLLEHHPMMRSETGPFSGCRCGQVRLGQDVVLHVLTELFAALPVRSRVSGTVDRDDVAIELARHQHLMGRRDDDQPQWFSWCECGWDGGPVEPSRGAPADVRMAFRLHVADELLGLLDGDQDGAR